MENRELLRYQMSETDSEYIETMFSLLADSQPTPDGTVPRRHPRQSRY